jgi:arylsulfatase A-like enzyme/Tfp pilus assembly protein PilF
MSLLALVAGAVASLAAPARPNIVLVTIDTLRADHVGSYGASLAATPRLDALARRGVRFDQAVSPVPLTRPAHASLFTGLYPHEHGLRDNLPRKLDPSIPTLARKLQQAGYQTGASVGTFLIGRGSGLEAGFERFSDGAGSGAADRIGASAERRATEVLADAVAFLQKANPPFFLWAHLYDPHAPYDPPSPFPKTYAGEVAYVDAEIGKLLDAIESRGFGESTWILVTADHGEGLGEHGEDEHGVLVYESTLRVPLILKRPGGAAGVEREPVSLVDVFPTLLEAAGLASPMNSLLAPKRRPLYFESYYGNLHFGWAPLRGVREGSWKLTIAPRSELFDLTADPREDRDVANERKGEARRLHAELQAIEARARTAAPPELLEPGAAEKLASLGYLGATAKRSTGADPKDEIGKFSDFGRRLRDATARFHRGDWRSALPLFEELAARDIQSFEVHLYLARCHQLAGDVASALREYEAASLIYDDHSVLHLERGRMLVQAGQLEAAAASFEKSLAMAPSADTAIALATARRKLGDSTRAMEALRTALSLDAADADSWNELGALLLSGDRIPEAIEAFEKAVALRPGDELFQHNLAFARERAGRP